MSHADRPSRWSIRLLRELLFVTELDLSEQGARHSLLDSPSLGTALFQLGAVGVRDSLCLCSQTIYTGCLIDYENRVRKYTTSTGWTHEFGQSEKCPKYRDGFHRYQYDKRHHIWVCSCSKRRPDYDSDIVKENG